MRTLVEHLRARGVECEIQAQDTKWDREGIDAKLAVQRGDGKVDSIPVQITAVPQDPKFWAAARHDTGIIGGDAADLVAMALSAIQTKCNKSLDGSVLVVDARHVAALTKPQIVAAIVDALSTLAHPFAGIVITGPTAAMSAVLEWEICPLSPEL